MSPPDVLVADLAMPGEDGYELIRQVRMFERAGGRRMPAIAVTALASAEDRRRALAAGFDVHLAKPTEPSDIVAAVARVARGALAG
ncbi:MAG: response regulator [Deltaproteobacteria bacterium]|nr:MAG: response regulator [Deltaproteobacteria bacterium]